MASKPLLFKAIKNVRGCWFALDGVLVCKVLYLTRVGLAPVTPIPVYVVSYLVVKQVLNIEAAKAAIVELEVPPPRLLNQFGVESSVNANGLGHRAGSAHAQSHIAAPRVDDNQPHATPTDELRLNAFAAVQREEEVA
jgi:hypothetical protein